jgi:hypothetical protein
LKHLITTALALIVALSVWSGTASAAADPASVEATDAFCKAVKQTYVAEHIRSYYRDWKTCGKACGKRHKAWTKYRTKHFGYFKGFGKRAWNEHAPKHFAAETVFMGRKVTLNQWVIPVLKCVERDLKTGCATCPKDPERPEECTDKRFPYAPKALSGLRHRNTFRGGEVSNHVYGIALDVDPAHNTCCGCTARWRAHPLCKRKLKPHQRMIMPWCWVEIFEQYGFYWLGRDKLQDTMHYDFLGELEVVQRAVAASVQAQ